MLKKEKDYNINGHIIEATFLKSRTAASYVPFELIFDKQNGYSPALTLFHLGFSQGFIKKQGNKYYVDGLEDITFSKKDCIKTAAKHPEIINALYEHSLKHLQQYLGVDTSGMDDQNDDEAYSNVMDMLMNV